MSQQPFRYWSYWDAPRCIAFAVDGRSFLLLSEFDESMDDYAPDYRIYETETLLTEAPTSLNCGHYRGRIPVLAVAFDESKRQWLNADPILNAIS